MRQQFINSIASFWTDRILQGADSVPLERLYSIEMPETIRRDFTSRIEELITSQINILFDSPYFIITAEEADAAGIIKEVLETIKGHVVFSGEKVREIVTATYSALFDKWVTDSLKQSIEGNEPEKAAAEVFNRASLLSSSSAEGDKFGLEMIALICHTSGLPLIGNAVKIEKSLGMKKLDIIQFTHIIRRTLLLQDYILGEAEPEAEAAEEEETVPPEADLEESPEKPEPAEIPHPELEEFAKLDKPVEHEEIEESIEPEQPEEPEELEEPEVTLEAPEVLAPETIPEAEEPRVAEEPVVEPAVEEIDDTLRAAASLLGGENGAENETVIDSTPEAVEVQETVEKLEEPASALRSLLLKEENIAYFTGSLFKGDEEAYRNVVEEISNQDTLGNALSTANNEIFLRNAPPSSESAAKFIKIIKRLYKDAE